MEEMSSAVALPFRMGSSLCDNSMEITRLKLITDTAMLLSDPIDDSTGGGCSCHSEIVIMVEAGDGVSLEPQVVSGSDEDEIILVQPEKSLESSRSLLIISDGNGSSCSIVKDLPLLHASPEIGTPSLVDAAVISLLNADLVTAPYPLLEKLSSDAPVVVNDAPVILLPVVAQATEEIQICRTSQHPLIVSNHTPLWGHVSICGGRPEMEDAMAIVPHFLEISHQMLTGSHLVDGCLNPSSTHSSGHYFGVYDGHGGAQVANYCKERMHMALIEEIRKLEGSACGVGNDCQKKWETALTNCFLKVDAEAGGEVNGKSGISEEFSNPCSAEPIAPETVGSTAVVAVLFSSHIIIANCGDSRAVLCRGKQALPLSVDHKPSREDEYERIEAAGGKVIQWNGFRVFGVLAMSRSIGDRYLKPSIIPDPEVTFLPRTKEDECLILASDGLWDVMTNEEACDAARRRILMWHKKNSMTAPVERGGADPAAQAAADYLARLALQRGSKDNITVIVIDLKAHRKFKSKA
ncbi:hypothetical protein Taro_031224 [Colocasia esculenta]|uniref:protein-serine/threonine phosphatase n=1 Tax=Colocasia esculenta TaxID=4460 RepID=A0A843VYF3_COLES|nr:hypothetical protein [Colocasia esculenta]